jgi:cell division transport system permease protein
MYQKEKLACLGHVDEMNEIAANQHLPAVYDESEKEAPPRASRKAPIVPPGSVTGRSLVVVIAIMGFLACLTTGLVYMINRSASAWLHGISSELTVRVQPDVTPEEVEHRAKEVEKFLNKQPGVKNSRLQTLEETFELIKPWLGQVTAIKELPIPRLIELQIDRDNVPDIEALRKTLSEKFAGVMLDDHRAWQQQIRRVTGSLAFGGIALIILVVAATIGIIVSAAKSAMASNREIIEVLHFVGAEERFIARQFELHFLFLGIKAGVVGAVAAALVFLLMPSFSEFLSGAGTQAEFHRLFGRGYLDAFGYAFLLLVVVVIAAICQLTSRYGVRHILNLQNQ